MDSYSAVGFTIDLKDDPTNTLQGYIKNGFISVLKSPMLDNVPGMVADNHHMELFELQHPQYLNYKATWDRTYIFRNGCYIPRFIVKPYDHQPICQHEKCWENLWLNSKYDGEEDIAYGTSSYRGQHSYKNIMEKMDSTEYHNCSPPIEFCAIPTYRKWSTHEKGWFKGMNLVFKIVGEECMTPELRAIRDWIDDITKKV